MNTQELTKKAMLVLINFFTSFTIFGEDSMKIWFFTVKLFLANFCSYAGDLLTLMADCEDLSENLVDDVELELEPSEIDFVKNADFDLNGCFNLFRDIAKKFSFKVRDYVKVFTILESMWLLSFASFFDEECLYTSAFIIASRHLGRSFNKVVCPRVAVCVKYFQKTLALQKYFASLGRYKTLYDMTCKNVIEDLERNKVRKQSVKVEPVSVKRIGDISNKIADGGGFGDVVMDGKVCYKFHRDSSCLLALLSEIKFLRSYKHKNLISLKDIVITPNRIGFSMKKCDYSLRRLIGKGMKIGLRVVEQILKGLAFMHNTCGYAHLDLKIDNVVVDAGKQIIKIIDFGSVSKIGTKGSGIHTRKYVSPERYCWTSVKACADIWAVGCILYKIASGEHFFKSDVSLPVIHDFLLDYDKGLGLHKIYDSIMTWETRRSSAQELLDKFF